MARKGDAARAEVMERLLSAFDGAFLADKKVYVSVIENGEPIQFAISLTMPKVPVVAAGGAPTASNHDWSGESAPVAQPINISEEDSAKVEALMQKLGIK